MAEASACGQESSADTDPRELSVAASSQPGAIVVLGKRLAPVSPLHGSTPRRKIPASILSTYGVNSLGELLKVLKESQAGPEPDVVVNGRRLGSISDLDALPPEVLESIEIYDGPDNQRFGFAPRGALLFNLVLKRRFRSLGADTETSETTDGGRAHAKLGVSGVRLRGDARLNAALSASADAELRASQRPNFGINSESGSTAAAAHSLLPAGRHLDATVGLSLPLGSDMLEISTRASVSRNSTHPEREAKDNNFLSLQPRRQWTTVNMQKLSLTYSGNRGSWFAILMGNISRTASHSHAIVMQGAEGGGCQKAMEECRLQDVSSAQSSVSATLQAGGPVLSLPAGQARIDLGAGFDHLFTVNADRMAGSRNTYRYNTSHAQFSLAMPLVDSRVPLIGAIGRLEISPSFTFDRNAGSGHVFGKAIAVNWRLSPALSFNAVVEKRGSLPSAIQLSEPQVLVRSVNVYDYRAGGFVTADRLTGNAPLERQDSGIMTLSANYARQSGTLLTAVSATYFDSLTNRPITTLVEPSPLLERQFPGRFVRNSQGALLLVDARPFNALQSITRSVSGSVDLSGALRTEVVPSKIESDDLQIKSSGYSAVSYQWRLGLRIDYTLEQSLKLGMGAAAIDLIAHPLSIAGVPPSRWTILAQGGLASPRAGFDFAYRWRNGTRSEAQSGSTGIHAEPLGTFDLSGFYNVQSAKSAGQTRPGFQLLVVVRNVFNERPKVTTLSYGGMSRLNPWILSPEGRVVALSVTVRVGGGASN